MKIGKNKIRLIEGILFSSLTIILLNILIDFGVIPYYTNRFFEQMITISIAYTAFARLLSYRKIYKFPLIFGNFYFIYLCIMIYYSQNIADLVSAMLCFYINFHVLFGLKFLSEQEKK